MPSSCTFGLICSIILRHRRAYISENVASSVAFSKTSLMTCISVRPSFSLSDLFAHAMIWSEIESKRSIVSLFSSPFTLRSTISGDSPSTPGPLRRVLPATQRFADISSGAICSRGGPMPETGIVGPALPTTLERLESFAPRLLRVRSRPVPL